MSSIALQPVLIDHIVPVKTNRRMIVNTVSVIIGALIVGILAQVNVPLYPVPITGQTLGVMLVGAVLGARRGGASLLTYMVLGVLGVPWFAGFAGGFHMLYSPTFGYIIGFVFTAYVIGWLSERQWDRHPLWSLFAFAIASIIPYIFGIPYMWEILHLAGHTLNFVQTMNAGFTPFIIGGIIKWLIGAAILPLAWKGVRKIENANK